MSLPNIKLIFCLVIVSMLLILDRAITFDDKDVAGFDQVVADLLYIKATGETRDINTTGDYISTGGGTWTSTANGDLTIDPHGTGNITNKKFTQYCDGACPTPGSAGADGGAIFESAVEFDGFVWFDSYAILGNTQLTNNYVLWLGSINTLTGALRPHQSDTGEGQLSLTLGTKLGRRFIIGPAGSHTIVYNQTNLDNPGIEIHSETTLDGNTDEFLRLYHNQTDAVVKSGKGDVFLDPASGNVQIGEVVTYAPILSATPSEPVTCESGRDGDNVYVDDTDDTNYGQLCICSNLDGTGYDWRTVADTAGTACPFF